MQTAHDLRVEGDDLRVLRTPRRDVVAEELEDRRPATAGDPEVLVFRQVDGPFDTYRRELTIRDDGTGDGRPASVHEEIGLTLPPGTWKLLTYPLIAQGFRRTALSRRIPWWAPTQRLTPRAARVLGLLATLSAALGYVASLLTQTMTFAAEEFAVGTTAQGVVFSGSRIGATLAIGLTVLADRRGRQRMLMVSVLVAVAATAAGALTPNVAGLGVTQAVSRGAVTAAAVLTAVILAEEMPKGARAWALSQVTMAGGAGAGVVLLLLPLAEIGEQAWRLLYAAPVLLLPAILRCARQVPETRRFARPHTAANLQGHRGRLWLIAGMSLLLNILVAPTSQFRNEFLREERMFSATAISIFVAVTGGLAVVGIIGGGRLAEAWGRRTVGSAAAAGAALFLAAMFAVGGPLMWVAGTAGMIAEAALVPSTSLYGAELFPTSLRGRANGIVGALAMVGSVAGLLAAGAMADHFGSFGPAMGLLAAGPVIAAVLIVTSFPETAQHELEDLNPEDLDDPEDPEDVDDVSPRSGPESSTAAGTPDPRPDDPAPPAPEAAGSSPRPDR